MEHSDAHIRHHAILRFVRALLAPVLIFLRGSEAKHYLRMVQVKLTEAENKVREWLAGLALGMDVSGAMGNRRRRERVKMKKRRRPRAFSVLPPLLRALPREGLRTRPAPLDTRWVDRRAASCAARAELLEVVIAAPEAYVRRLARMFAKRDALALALRFLSVRIELPREQIKRRLAPPETVLVNDSS